MNIDQLFTSIVNKKSFLCIGLDTHIDKIPAHLKKYDNPLFRFNKKIVDATQHFAMAYKPNIAFYEAQGIEGWKALEETVIYIKQTYPDIFLIADAKRGDIGNTSGMYAKAFFEKLPFDAITVAPYMGEDSVRPFFEYPDKWVILLSLTSNSGANDFQKVKLNTNKYLFEQVLINAQRWGSENNLMFVVGATNSENFREVRDIVPDHFLLVPGVGAQGGNLEDVISFGMNKKCGLIINSSRSIIYAGSGHDFDLKAASEAHKIQEIMKKRLAQWS